MSGQEAYLMEMIYKFCKSYPKRKTAILINFAYYKVVVPIVKWFLS